MERVDGRRALVTGGSRGIGAAVAVALRDRGATVAIGGRNQASFDGFVARHGADRVLPARGDIGTRGGCRQVVADALGALGGLDMLVTAAGVYWEAEVDQIDADHWDSTLAINLGGTFHCIQAALPALRASRGCVVCIASDAGITGYAGAVAYAASKAGVVSLTRSLALELVPDVRVNCICPGNVDTDMIQEAAQASGDPDSYLAWAHGYAPMGRMARPEEVAAAATYLVSDAAAFVTGAVLSVDGGKTAGVR